MTKTFTFAGVSIDKGKLGLRLTSRSEYEVLLEKRHKHTNIDIIALPHAMERVPAITHLLSQPNFLTDNPGAEALLKSKLGIKTEAPAATDSDANSDGAGEGGGGGSVAGNGDAATTDQETDTVTDGGDTETLTEQVEEPASEQVEEPASEVAEPVKKARRRAR